jgi:hypothetical protein
LHGLAECLHGGLAVAGIGFRETEFTPCSGPARLGPHEWFERRHGGCRLPRATLTDTEYQRGGEVAGHLAEDFTGLLDRERRLGGQQPLRVRERDLQRTHGLRPGRHPFTPCFDTTAHE